MSGVTEIEAHAPSWHLGFASSDWSFDEAKLSEITTTYAQEYVRRFLHLYAPVLRECSTGLVSLIARWTRQPADFRTVWDFAFGNVQKAVLVRPPKATVIEIAVLLGLRLVCSGAKGKFRSGCGGKIRPIWGDYLLPECDRLEVNASDDLVSITSVNNGDETLTVFQTIGGRWKSRTADALISCKFESVTFAFAPSSVISIFENQSASVDELQLHQLKQFKTECLETLKLIEQHAPSVLAWIGRVLRYIVPLQPGILSGSSANSPGVLEISFNHGPVAMAELLIHECAHQYFFLLARTEQVDDGSDGTLYFSPLRNTGRPVKMILAGYHALANTLLFYRSCRLSGLQDDGYCARYEEKNIPMLEQLETALRKTSALTQVGKSLWLPLSHRLIQG